MVETLLLDTFLGGARVDDAVFVLRPDYRAVLLAVDGLVPGPSDEASEVLLEQAESVAREALRERPVEQLPHIAVLPTRYPDAWKILFQHELQDQLCILAIGLLLPYSLPLDLGRISDPQLDL